MNLFLIFQTLKLNNLPNAVDRLRNIIGTSFFESIDFFQSSTIEYKASSQEWDFGKPNWDFWIKLLFYKYSRYSTFDLFLISSISYVIYFLDFLLKIWKSFFTLSLFYVDFFNRISMLIEKKKAIMLIADLIIWFSDNII